MMKRFTRITFYYCLFLALAIAPRVSFAHPGHHDDYGQDTKNGGTPRLPNAAPIVVALADTRPIAAEATSMPQTSGQGHLKFRVLYTADHLPQEAVAVLVKAHGGFAVDRRDGKGETYFSLPGAGIIQLSADLKTTRMLDTPPEMKNVNLHDAAIWYDVDGTPYLSFPANDAGVVFTTTLDGKLVHALNAPTADDDFDQPTVNAYFRQGGKFAPTDVKQLEGLFYITTGYSDLDYVLTAKIFSTKPFVAKWYDLAFGGKGDAPGQFGTGHGITVVPGGKRLAVSDRANAKVDRFTRYGQYRDTLQLPKGSFPCDIDYAGGYAIIGCLYGPDRSKGAPIYIIKDDTVVSTIMPKEELGLETFQHIHNAVLLVIEGKFYIVAQTWNPGDFAILEQVTE